jgi:hypothetical protein
MVVFLFNIVIYVFFIARVYVFLLLSMYVYSYCSSMTYCSSMYSYLCLCILIVVHAFLDLATLTEFFPCFFLGCKVGLHSSNCCVVLCIVCFVSFYVLFVCKSVLLLPGDNPLAVNKYIISYAAGSCSSAGD